MHLYFSAAIARNRETNEAETLASFANLGPAQENVGNILGKQAEVLSDGSEGIALRKKYSHLLVIVDNQPRASYQFPDADLEAEAKTHADRRAAALVERTAAEKALAEHEAAAAALRDKLGAKPAAPVTPVPVAPVPVAPVPVAPVPVAPVPVASDAAETAGPTVGDRTPSAEATVASVATVVAAKATKQTKP